MGLLEFIYINSIFWLAVYGYHALIMTWYRFTKYKAPARERMLVDKECPFVTIQLPLYNERYVVERLINCIVNLDYPQNKLEIQVLDDSTDDTSDIVKKIIGQFQAKGLDIKQICRSERLGYKAGALKYGLASAKGDFIAIFDADFMPPPDFLKKTLAYFKDDQKIGCVQTRWGHLNRESSWLTKAQASGVDGHFVIEQAIRSESSLFLNFNGTAGIWRRECIIAAGGWQHDTLTEDLDLSFRAQLKGWLIHYTPYVLTPAELPAHINALKQQQFRWAKGSIQTSRKLLKELWNSPQPLLVKISGTLHLTNYLVHPLMILNLVMHLFIILVGNRQFLWVPLFTLAAIGPSLMYWMALREEGKTIRESIQNLFMLLILGIGMSYNNTRAVAEALFSIESPFKRTPKFDLRNNEQFNKASDYLISTDVNLWVELCLGILSFGLMVFTAANGTWGTVFWMMLSGCGYLYIAYLSYKPLPMAKS
jgi:cellulose synthase/poly-beta-1,6-N-acetylglucosamine synthase-like glycosyltransferase